MPFKARGIDVNEIDARIKEIEAIIHSLNVDELSNMFKPRSSGKQVKRMYVKNNKLQVEYES